MFVEDRNEAGETHTVLSGHHNFVAEDDLIAELAEANSPEDAERFADPAYPYHSIVPFFQLKTGAGIHFDETAKNYRAKQYGFIVNDSIKGLHLIIPFQITKDKTKAYYLIHPANNGKLSDYDDIGAVISENKITAPVDPEIIKAEILKIDPAVRQITKVKIAQSMQEPVNGKPEYYTLLIDTTRKAGKLQLDGKIDFKDQGSIIQVSQGEEVLQRHMEVQPSDGTDIFGNKVAAVNEMVEGYEAGDNISPSVNNPEIYVSAIDGYLEIDKKRVSVKAVLTISGDVNYERGNIDYNGSVIIKGSVHPSFSVKSRGDILIEQSVDEAAIEAGGNITVKMGISGKGPEIIKAAGSVSAKFIQNAHVEAGGEIMAEDSIINSKVFSNKKVIVSSAHGRILGGETIALYKIEVNSAGSETVSNTVLTVGRNLELERELESVRSVMNRQKDLLQTVMTKLTATFGSQLFEDPKKYVESLPEVKKILCLELLSEESNINKKVKELMEQVSKIEQKLILEEEPVIIIKDKIYPGTVLNIKKSKLEIEKEITNARFFESPEENVIQYGPIA